MGCASGKPASRQEKSPVPEVAKESHSHQADPKVYNFITIEVQNKESLPAIPLFSQPPPPPDNVREQSASAEAHESRSTSKGEAKNDKENKEDSRKQLLKKYDIKVNNNSQRVLPVNSYRYDILLPHNPQMGEEEAPISTIVLGQKEERGV